MRTPRNDPLGSDIAGSEAGPGESAGPERRCILTGTHGARDDLVRLALSPDGDLLPDPLARAPGRGAWIGVSRDQLAGAQASGKLTDALVRAFKGTRPNVPDDLPERIEQGLRQVVLQRLGLEMRAGRIILGSDRIERDARMGRVAALYHAADAGEDGSRKLDQALRVGRDAEGSGQTGLRLPLDREALSVALGRDNVVHLALADAASARRLEGPLRRLLNYLSAGSDVVRSPGGDDRAARNAARETPLI